MKLMLNERDGRPPPVCKNLKNVSGDLEGFSKRGKTFLETWKSFRGEEKRFWRLGKVFEAMKNVSGNLEGFSGH